MRAGASSSTRSTATQLTRSSPNDAASARSRSSRRATSTSEDPGSRARRRAAASPIPLEAPVISAIIAHTLPICLSRISPFPSCLLSHSLPVPITSRYGGPMDSTDSARKLQALELFGGLPSRYDRLSAALSFWQDPRWRRAMVDAVAPAANEQVLDVATGTGMVAAELRRRADCSIVGLDQSTEMLAAAR